MTDDIALIPVERIEKAILLIRGQKVMLDRDLARLYGVATGALKRAVKRNAQRFPSDFMFQLTVEEADTCLRSRCQTGTLKRGKRTPLKASGIKNTPMTTRIQPAVVNIIFLQSTVGLCPIVNARPIA